MPLLFFGQMPSHDGSLLDLPKRHNVGSYPGTAVPTWKHPHRITSATRQMFKPPATICALGEDPSRKLWVRCQTLTWTTSHTNPEPACRTSKPVQLWQNLATPHTYSGFRLPRYQKGQRYAKIKLSPTSWTGLWHMTATMWGSMKSLTAKELDKPAKFHSASSSYIEILQVARIFIFMWHTHTYTCLYIMYMYITWLVVWNMNFNFPYIGNVMSSQLTFTPWFFRGVGIPTTNQPVTVYLVDDPS